MASGSSSSKQSKLGTLQTLNVINASEFAYLSTLENAFFPSSAQGVFSVIETLAKAAMRGDVDENEFLFVDRAGTLLKFHESGFFTGWSQRKFALEGTVLEYQSNKSKDGANVINLTPESFCTDSSLSAAEKKHGFVLVTPKKTLQLACASFAEKLLWVSSLSRAILIPRRRVVGVPQSILFKGALAATEESSSVLTPELIQKFDVASVVAHVSVKFSNTTTDKKATKKYMALQSHMLQLWKDEQSFTKGKRPTNYVFLEHSITLVKRNEVCIELRLLSQPASNDATIIEFDSAKVKDEWKFYLEASLAYHRKQLKTYLDFFKSVPQQQRKSVPPMPPPQPVVVPVVLLATPPKPKASAEEAPVPPPNKPKTSPPPPPPPAVFVETTPPIVKEEVKPVVVAEPVVPAVTEPLVGDEEEERDPRPVVELRLRKVDAEGIPVTDKDLVIGKLHIDLTATLVYCRDEIYNQINPDHVPMKFTFLRVRDGVQSQLFGPSALNRSSAVTQSQEEEVTVDSCLIQQQQQDDTNSSEAGASKYMLLSCPEEFIKKSTDAEQWERERKAYQQEIMHLEAQLAEARRALHDRARQQLKRSTELDEARSHLFTSLSALQRDGFLESSVNLEEIEEQYLFVFHEEDALKAFAFSPNCPLRVVWRKLCGDPKRMRKYIEDLENFVLKPYRIRKERLGSPFWSMQVLRDSRFIEDSGKFQEWAKQEPWCEDDAERYVYLTSKLFYVSESAEEFIILTRPVPDRPPEPKRKLQPQEEAETVKKRDAFKESRPKSFMAGADAQEAMKKFKQRKSASLANLVAAASASTAPVVPSSKPVVTVETLHEDEDEEKADEPAPRKIAPPLLESEAKVDSKTQTEEIPAPIDVVAIEKPEHGDVQRGSEPSKSGTTASPNPKSAPEVPLAKASRRGSGGELPNAVVDAHLVDSASIETVVSDSKPALPANKPRRVSNPDLLQPKSETPSKGQDENDDVL